ncbi:hypothetical protein CEXT_691511 [Caerostris extrusa]|uniref:Uncharacterized protein n=1 Tax=Caerostris extrusa TaxID=172846 RepID=A0AAV4SGQ3_CAEEX|nr:hypothetical protein CEXT_691511 [Caerostris extrusa]
MPLEKNATYVVYADTNPGKGDQGSRPQSVSVKCDAVPFVVPLMRRQWSAVKREQKKRVVGGGGLRVLEHCLHSFLLLFSQLPDGFVLFQRVPGSMVKRLAEKKNKNSSPIGSAF